MQKNASFLAIVAVNTAENEPSKVGDAVSLGFERTPGPGAAPGPGCCGRAPPPPAAAFLKYKCSGHVAGLSGARSLLYGQLR